MKRFFMAMMLLAPFAATASDLRTMIGGMIVAGFRGTELAESNHIIKDIKNHHIAGVVLFDYDTPTRKYDRNIKSPGQLRRLTDQLHALDPELIIGIDQEGGMVSRLKERYGFPPTISAQKLGALDDTLKTRAAAAAMAHTLAQMGIDIDFAPCVDLNVNPACPVIGAVERSFGSNPATIVRHAAIFLDELQKAGVKGCLKHFPGHGSSTKDTHLAAADVTATWSERELEPFVKLFEKAPLIMTSHIFNARLDPAMPATMSRAILTDLLRNKLGYQGVIITDDLGMAAMVDNYSLEEILVHAVNAGADLLCLGNNGTSYDPALVGKAIDIIERAVNEGRIPRSRIEQANKRVAQIR